MIRLIYLFTFLLTIITLSSLIHIEHFLYNFNIKFKSKVKPIDNNDHQIQIKNLSHKDIYIIFTKSGDEPWDTLVQNWKFYLNTTTDITTRKKITTNDSYMYFSSIPSGSLFSCEYVGNLSLPKWISGKCCITSVEPNDNFVSTGLTGLEWTFNPDENGTFNPDLSALEGINIQVDMQVVHGDDINCDTTDKKTCKIDFTHKNVTPFIKEDINGIKSVRRPVWKDEYKQYAGYENDGNTPSKCGFSDNNANTYDCIECPFGTDPCNGVTRDVTLNPCYPLSIDYRWGCYKWWANPNNQVAQSWLKVYETGEGCTNSYRWVFDETGIYLPSTETSLNTINKSFLDDGEKWDRNFYKWKCATNSPDSEELRDGNLLKQCIGYPVTKNSADGPNINCNKGSKNIRLIYQIYDVL